MPIGPPTDHNQTVPITQTAKSVVGPLRIQLSSLTVMSGLTWPSGNQLQVGAIWIGGQNSGRYTVQIGGDLSQAFWLLASKSESFAIPDDFRWIINGGEQITVNAPGSGAWDLTLFCYPTNVTPAAIKPGGR